MILPDLKTLPIHENGALLRNALYVIPVILSSAEPKIKTMTNRSSDLQNVRLSFTGHRDWSFVDKRHAGFVGTDQMEIHVGFDP